MSRCPVCGKTAKQFDSFDEAKLQEVDRLNTSAFPTDRLIENSRINITRSTGADRFDRNFCNRAKYALLTIQYAISQLPVSPERDVLQHALVSALTLSRITQYSSCSEYIYQVMREKAQESNVWWLFESKYKLFARLKQQELKDLQADDLDASNPRFINGSYDDVLSAPRYHQHFDLILTDPPYTDQVPYLERNQMYRIWLQHFVDRDRFGLTKGMLEKEMVVSNSPERPDKNLYNYISDIQKMFRTFYQVLKDNGIVIMVCDLGMRKYFEVFSQFINKARAEGFEYAFRVDVSKKDPTLRKQAAWKNTLSTQSVIGFVKLPEERRYWYHNDTNVEFRIAKKVYSIIRDRGENGPAFLEQCILAAQDDLLGIGIEAEAGRISRVIREQFSVVGHYVDLDPEKLYVSLEDDSTLFNKLYNLLPELVNRLLTRQNEFTLDDLYFEISARLCSGDHQHISRILEDSTHQNLIKMLLRSLCDITPRGYVRRRLTQNVSQNAIDIAMMSADEFEGLIKRLLEHEGYRDVLIVGGAGDRGIDLIAKKDRGERVGCHVFQAKRWVNNVGPVPIQRLHSMISQRQNNYQYGECFTTADYTAAARREARETGIKLSNGRDLMIRLEAAFPGQYYHSLLENEEGA